MKTIEVLNTIKHGNHEMNVICVDFGDTPLEKFDGADIMEPPLEEQTTKKTVVLGDGTTSFTLHVNEGYSGEAVLWDECDQYITCHMYIDFRQFVEGGSFDGYFIVPADPMYYDIIESGINTIMAEGE